MTTNRSAELEAMRGRARRDPRKRWARALAALVLAVLPFSGEAAERKGSSGPQMEIQPEEHDFGNVQQSQNLVYAFTVLNTGNEELVISRISTSCGCTAAIVSDRVVPPGGTTKLEVTLETRKYRGVVQRSVSVASNDPDRVRTVRVRAFVEPDD